MRKIFPLGCRCVTLRVLWRCFPLLDRRFDSRLGSSLFTAVVFVVEVVVLVCVCALFCSVCQVPNTLDPVTAKHGLPSAMAFGVLLVGWWMAFVGW